MEELNLGPRISSPQDMWGKPTDKKKEKKLMTASVLKNKQQVEREQRKSKSNALRKQKRGDKPAGWVSELSPHMWP